MSKAPLLRRDSKRCGFIILLLVASSAYAADVSVSWKNAPDLPPIAITIVEWGTCDESGHFLEYQGDAQTNAPAETLTLTNIPFGGYCFRAYHATPEGRSTYSNAVKHLVGAPIITITVQPR